MIERTLAQVADAVDGTVAEADPRQVVTAVSTDSREVEPGGATLFVARRGEQQDGHDHARGAVEAGAVAVLASRDLPGVPRVVVDDTDAALGRLARHVRDVVAPDVVGITGSVGKTTTKDLVRAACGATRRTVGAQGSYNNEVGVPLTLLATRADTEVLVVEMGARGVGQVADLAEVARPTIGVVTAVAGVHLELFGSLDAVAEAKGELVAALPAEGTAVLNVDDERVAAMAARTAASVLRVSATGDAPADLTAADVRLDARARATFTARTPWGDHAVTLPVAGRHHVGNALAALAVAGAAGADVGAAAAALASAEVSQWRGAVVELDGVVVLDDAYNANPTSTLAALDTLAAMEVPGRRIAVLGVMAEIGDDHETEHWRIGMRAAGVLDRLVVVGDDAAPITAGARDAAMPRVDLVPDAAAAVEALDDLADGDAVLVKASRVAGLEAVTQGIRARRRPAERTS
jgi:UDP-N-acetylmuramoyl-tripeptide--D-alanyl-D-alanine ligase